PAADLVKLENASDLDGRKEVHFGPDGPYALVCHHTAYFSSSFPGVTERYWCYVLNPATGKVVAGPPKDLAYVSAAFSPNGKRIVPVSKGGGAHVWDAKTGELVAGPHKHKSEFPPPFGEVEYAAFSPDSKRLVTANTLDVQVWDVESGKVVAGPFWDRAGY